MTVEESGVSWKESASLTLQAHWKAMAFTNHIVGLLIGRFWSLVEGGSILGKQPMLPLSSRIGT